MNKYWPEEWKKKLPNFLGENFFSNFESFENWENLDEFADQTNTNTNTNKSNANKDINNSSSIRVNMYESGHELLCVARLPGLVLKEVDIDIEDNIIEILGNVKVDHYGFRAIQEELYQGPVKRRFKLPYPVRKDKIDVSYKHGHLLIHLHRHFRSPEAKPKLQIEDLDDV